MLPQITKHAKNSKSTLASPTNQDFITRLRGNIEKNNLSSNSRHRVDGSLLVNSTSNVPPLRSMPPPGA